MNLSRYALGVLTLTAACGGSDNKLTPDAPPDTGSSCNAVTVLPTEFRPIPMVSQGAVTVTTTGDVTSGTIDARAGGGAASPENPYIYVDLRTGTRVDINDVDARTSTNWDIAFKRYSIHTNGGDSGPGNRKVAVVAAATLAEVTAGPAAGYTVDDFTTDDCMLATLFSGEPSSALGQWYEYNTSTNKLKANAEVYVIERNNGSRTAFRIVSYYADDALTMAALYRVEWKQLPNK